MSKFNMDTLAANLRGERAKKRMSMEQVAKAIGVSSSTIKNWESGENIPLIDSIASLAELYGTTVDDLIGFKKAQHSA